MIKKLLAVLGVFILIFSNNVINVTNSSNAIYKEKYYCDTNYFDTGLNFTTIENDVYYDDYEIIDNHLERFCPNYDNINHTNSCAPLAGTILIGYYDYEYENLIPNFVSGSYYNNIFTYRPRTSKVQAVKDSLYNLMGTNSIEPGTSVNQFKTGLQSYVNNSGYNISYNSCGSNFNLQTALGYFNSEMPIALFLTGYEYYPENGLFREEGHYSMGGRLSSGTHVCIAYGYRQLNYYNDGELFRSDNYLIVVYGDGTQGLLALNTNTGIDEAYGIDIY